MSSGTIANARSRFSLRDRANAGERIARLTKEKPSWEPYALEAQADPVAWIEKHFRIPETPDHRLQLGDYQRKVLGEVLAQDIQGNFPYSVIVWGDIKKSIKSCIAAAVVLWMCWVKPWASVKIVANDLKQADSRVAYYLRRSIELNPEMAQWIRVRPSGYTVSFPNHSKIEAIPVDPSGEAGGNDDMIVFSELWAAKNDLAKRMWCYDEQTEILTDDGWIKGVDLELHQAVATVNPATQRLEWQYPRSIYNEPYSGPMHRYQTRDFDLLVTPNHRLYGQYSYNGKANPYTQSGVMRSDDLRASGFRVFHPRMTVSGFTPYLHEADKPLEMEATKFKPAYSIDFGDWCEFMGWFVSEGNVKRNGHNPVTVVLTQQRKVNPEKWQRLHDCLVRCFGPGGFSIQDDETSFRVHSAPLARHLELQGDSYDKFVPYGIKESSPENLRRFLEAALDGDGTRYKNGSAVYYTHSSRLADDVSEIAFKLGYTVSSRWCSSTRGYRVHISPGRDGYARWVGKDRWTEESYIGRVWCPSVPNGLLVIRRSGVISVCGNTEMTLSPTKMGKSFRWVETYAGFDGESPLLEQLYHSGVKEGEPPDWAYDLNPPLPIFENSAARLLLMWNDMPRLPWQTKDYYAQEAAVLTPSEFNRVHRNQWASSNMAFVPIEWWDRCLHKDWQPDPNAAMVLAMDAAVSNDLFAVVGVCGIDGENYGIVYANAWKAKHNQKIDFDDVRAEMVRLLNERNVIEIAYDPYQLEDMAGHFKKELIAHVKEFGQAGPRLIADKELFDSIRDRHIWHRGEHDLREHILNANAKNDQGRLRIVKRNEMLKIDLAVATSMALARAKEWRL